MGSIAIMTTITRFVAVGVRTSPYRYQASLFSIPAFKYNSDVLVHFEYVELRPENPEKFAGMSTGLAAHP